jgi:hypothetical protein
MRRTGPTPEGAVVASCLALLRVFGIFSWRNNTGVASLPGRGGKFRPVKFGEPGAPDIIGILHGDNGRFLGVECKRPLGPKGGTGGSEQTPEQAAFETSIADARGVYILARSGEDLENQLRAKGLIQ